MKKENLRAESIEMQCLVNGLAELNFQSRTNGSVDVPVMRTCHEPKVCEPDAQNNKYRTCAPKGEGGYDMDNFSMAKI